MSSTTTGPFARRSSERSRWRATSVELAADGAEALAAVERREPDAVVLDVLMPGVDGLEVCRLLRRRRSRVPILMLTVRDALGDRVEGLDAGADDYLGKPFELEELLARAARAAAAGRRPTRRPKSCASPI